MPSQGSNLGYLQGNIFCPHYGCLCTPYSVQRGKVWYYACVYDMKNRTHCPVQRINAEALHYTILREIKRAAKHHTVTHKLIAESGGWQEAPEALIGKKKQLVEMQINNITKAIA